MDEQLRKAISRVKAARAARKLAQGLRMTSHIRDPNGCHERVGESQGLLARGGGRPARQCKKPAVGRVENKPYCAQHIGTHQERVEAYERDTAFLRDHGVDPDTL